MDPYWVVIGRGIWQKRHVPPFAAADGLLVVGLTAEPERELAMVRQALPTVVAGAPHPYSGPPVESGCG